MRHECIRIRRYKLSSLKCLGSRRSRPPVFTLVLLARRTNGCQSIGHSARCTDAFIATGRLIADTMKRAHIGFLRPRSARTVSCGRTLETRQTAVASPPPVPRPARRSFVWHHPGRRRTERSSTLQRGVDHRQATQPKQDRASRCSPCLDAAPRPNISGIPDQGVDGNSPSIAFMISPFAAPDRGTTWMVSPPPLPARL